MNFLLLKISNFIFRNFSIFFAEIFLFLFYFLNKIFVGKNLYRKKVFEICPKLDKKQNKQKNTASGRLYPARGLRAPCAPLWAEAGPASLPPA
jgi:hypothetical protein